MKRREFITGLVGTAAWPLAARAQQDGRVRRVGVLMTTAADDPEGQARLAAFLQGLQQLGWIDGRNARIDTRWAAGNSDYTPKYAAELLTLAPDAGMVPYSDGAASASALVGRHAKELVALRPLQ